MVSLNQFTYSLNFTHWMLKERIPLRNVKRKLLVRAHSNSAYSFGESNSALGLVGIKDPLSELVLLLEVLTL